MVCKDALQSTGAIDSFFASSAVLPGNIYKVTATIKSKASYVGDSYKLELVDNDTGRILGTKYFSLSAGEGKSFTFEERMENKDTNLNLSLTDLNSLWWDSCEDFRDFTIKKANNASEEVISPILSATGITSYLLYGVGILVIFMILYMMVRR